MDTSYQLTTTDILTIILPTYLTPLILPNVAIAEIINYEAITECENELPAWCIGYFNWRGREVPLIAFDAFTDPEIGYSLDASHRIAIINAVTETTLPFYAIVSKGIPKLLRLRATDLDDLEGVEHASERIRILVNDEETIIPNLDYLEKAVRSEIPASKDLIMKK